MLATTAFNDQWYEISIGLFNVTNLKFNCAHLATDEVQSLYFVKMI